MFKGAIYLSTLSRFRPLPLLMKEAPVPPEYSSTLLYSFVGPCVPLPPSSFSTSTLPAVEAGGPRREK